MRRGFDPAMKVRLGRAVMKRWVCNASDNHRDLTRSDTDDTAELAVMSRDECELAKQEVNPSMCPLVIE